MILEGTKNISRLAVYCFYDKDGIIDDYVPYFLNDLKKNVSEIILVSNGKLTEGSKEKIKGIADKILERKNEGFDFWAYKTGIDHYGWDKISQYDELVLCNSTVYGPIYHFCEMFSEMNKRDIDFWGITQFYTDEQNPINPRYGYLPDHIQSYFLAFRKAVFCSREFQEYWDTLRPIETIEAAVGKNEALLTKKFEKAGYKWDVYVNTYDLKDYSDNPLMLYPLELLKDKKCPIIKVKIFGLMYDINLFFARGTSVLKLMDYIKDNTDFNTDLILDNILRAGNIGTIKEQLHLNYILPKYIQNSNPTQEKAALFIHSYFEDEIDKMSEYAQNISF